MIQKVITSENLELALFKVVRNKGSAGVDKMTVYDLKPHLDEHLPNYTLQIANGFYQVSPILGIEIPKSNGSTRLLGVPTVTDRVIQQALLQVLNPVFEPDFHPNSFGFRENRSAQDAIKQSLMYINSGMQEIVDIDLKNFFDQVDHAILLELIHMKVKCKMTLKLLRQFLRAPILKHGKLYQRRKGVPQGSPLSPLLSNILLNELDKELDNRGHYFVRYADDFSIYVRSKRAANRVRASVTRFLNEKLLLPINDLKSGIHRPSSFSILGFGFTSTYKRGDKGKYQLIALKSKWKEFKRKLKQLTRKTSPMSFDERIKHLNWVIRGWVNYFKQAPIKLKLKKIDEWLRNRLRYCIWTDWKKPKRKAINLARLGVDPIQARKWSYTRMGGWAVAQSPILRTTITIDRLKQRGYIVASEYYQNINFH